MAQFGTIWHILVQFGRNLLTLVQIGSIRFIFVHFCSIWPYLAQFGSVWHILAELVHNGLKVVRSGSFLLIFA